MKIPFIVTLESEFRGHDCFITYGDDYEEAEEAAHKAAGETLHVFDVEEFNTFEHGDVRQYPTLE